MDCRNARLLLEFTGPHSRELDSPDAAALERHVADCPDCHAVAEADSQVHDRLARAMRDVPLPSDLRGRLLTRLRGERRRWYLRQGRNVAAAAALLLAAWFGYGYWAYLHRPFVDPEDVVQRTLELRGMQAPQVEKWLGDEFGIHAALPSGLDCAWLVSYSRADFQGRLVPHLLFVRGQNYAEVYVLSADQFNLSVPRPRAGSGGITAELLFSPSNPKVAYFFKFNGESLDWLFLEGQIPAAT